MKITRRRFSQSLLAGASSVALAPFIGSGRAEACGEGVQPRRIVFIVEGCGMNYTRFTPADVPNVPAADMLVANNFTLTPMMNALDQYRDQMLLIDGLSNDQGLAGSGHSTGYAALSCVPNNPPSETGRPGAETLDQFLGRTMGNCAPFPNLLLAVGRTSAARLTAISANQDRRPVPHFCNPYDAYQQLFGPSLDVQGDASVRQAAMFELVRGDVARMRPRLAGNEKAKLDEIISAMDRVQAREESLRARGDALRACVPQLAANALETIEDRIEAHFDLTAAALTCDLTRVVTIASGCGYNFFDLPFQRLGLEGTKHQMGHGYVSGLDGLDLIHNFHAQQIATLCHRLALVPEGDGNMLDNTLIVWTNENGEQHHAGYQRWPVVLLAGSNMGVETGRYIRFPTRGAPGARTLPDLWNSVCHIMGEPRNDFGAAGREVVTGPIATISG
jgi:hypothetical protein